MTQPVDLRSDTVTQPTPAMREAMAQALVGDDGYGEDPTVNELERRFAQLTGKEAAIFVPSGVMANQIALRVHTRPGDVVVSGRNQHVVSFEMGAAARNASIQFATVDDDEGELRADEVVAVLEAEFDHQPHVGLVTVENSHMFSGGRVWRAEGLRAFRTRIGAVPLHLDGARLWNASVASGETLAELAAPADTVMSCLSKGLAAPMGSLLAGSVAAIEIARVERKRLGGAMRQAGFVAAAGLVALDEMFDRLAEDHRRARRLAEAVAVAFPASEYRPTDCETNIVAFNHPSARRLVARLAEHGVLAGTLSPTRARLVTHCDLTDADVERASEAIVLVGRESFI